MTQHFAVSTDGSEVAVADESGAVWRVPVAGGAPRPLAGLAPRQVPVRFTSDGALLVADFEHLPLQVERLLPNGQRQPSKVIAPPDHGWQTQLFLAVSEDGSSYAYSYTRSLADLFLADGLAN
jgi:hypothetical protein